jgi:hypothetical protein
MWWRYVSSLSYFHDQHCAATQPPKIVHNAHLLKTYLLLLPMSKMPTERRRKFGKTFEMMEGFCLVISMRVCRRHNTGKDNGVDTCVFS